jgi:hypothetical protein
MPLAGDAISFGRDREEGVSLEAISFSNVLRWVSRVMDVTGVVWGWNILEEWREMNRMSIGKRIRWNVLNATAFGSFMGMATLIQRDLREKQNLPV